MMPLEITWAWTVKWVLGDPLCRIMSFFRIFGLYLSGFILICISVDRYVFWWSLYLTDVILLCDIVSHHIMGVLQLSTTLRFNLGVMSTNMGQWHVFKRVKIWLDHFCFDVLPCCEMLICTFTVLIVLL